MEPARPYETSTPIRRDRCANEEELQQPEPAKAKEGFDHTGVRADEEVRIVDSLQGLCHGQRFPSPKLWSHQPESASDFQRIPDAGLQCNDDTSSVYEPGAILAACRHFPDVQAFTTILRSLLLRRTLFVHLKRGLLKACIYITLCEQPGYTWMASYF